MKDQELIRIAGIYHLLNEAEDRLYKMRRQCGESAFNRALTYLADRLQNLVYLLSELPPQ